MSRVRCNKPKSLVIVTRRTMNGATFFGINPQMAQRLFVFLLAAYSKAHNIDVIAACLMSNHCHLVLYDEDGVVSDFCTNFFGKMAEAWQEFMDKHTNIMRPDKIWDGRQPNIVGIPHEGALVRETVYTMRNPEHHEAVERSEDYRGFVTTLDMVASGRQVRRWRPPYYFRRKGGAFKKQETLVFKAPPNYTRQEWAEVLRLAIEAERNGHDTEEGVADETVEESNIEAQDDLNEDVADAPAEDLDPVTPDFPCTNEEVSGLDVSFPDGLDFSSSTSTHLTHSVLEPLRYIPRPRTKGVPDYAGPRRYQTAARAEYKRFIQQYRQALADMLAGKPAVFPCGTTGMRMQHKVPVRKLSQEQLEARERRLCEPLYPAEELRYPSRVHHFAVNCS